MNSVPWCTLARVPCLHNERKGVWAPIPFKLSRSYTFCRSKSAVNLGVSTERKEWLPKRALSGFFHVIWGLKTPNNVQIEGSVLLVEGCCLWKCAIKDSLRQHMVWLKACNCDRRFEAHAISLGSTFNFVMKVISWIDSSQRHFRKYDNTNLADNSAL